MELLKRLLVSRLAWALLGVLFLVALGSIVQRGLARDPRFLARPDFGGARLPAWADRAVVAPVIERLEALGPVSLFDPQFESKVRGAVASCAVVGRVRGVRRAWPNRYRVDFTLRRPFAVVETASGPIPFTVTGVRLPPEPYARLLPRLVPVRGLREPLPPAGETIRSDALLDAIATLVQLSPHLRALAPLRIRAVDVGEAHDPRGGVVLRTAHDIPVRWGRPRASVGENPVETKVRFLQVAQARLGELEGYAIDVRYDDVYQRQSTAP